MIKPSFSCSSLIVGSERLTRNANRVIKHIAMIGIGFGVSATKKENTVTDLAMKLTIPIAVALVAFGKMVWFPNAAI